VAHRGALRYDAFGVGPFVSLSLGQLWHRNIQGGFFNVDESIGKTALHEWLTLGVRGQLAL